MLTIMGAGYPRTGTSTLCEALRILGYHAIHHAPERVPLFPSDGCDWRLYDDVDAVTDAPAVMYWRELMGAYPDLRLILTMRQEDSWWESMKRHANTIRISDNIGHVHYSDRLHSLLFGCAEPSRYWWMRRYREHCDAVQQAVPAERLLIVDIVAGDKWEPLCRFLGKPEPCVEWPWENRAVHPRQKVRSYACLQP